MTHTHTHSLFPPLRPSRSLYIYSSPTYPSRHRRALGCARIGSREGWTLWWSGHGPQRPPQCSLPGARARDCEFTAGGTDLRAGACGSVRAAGRGWGSSGGAEYVSLMQPARQVGASAEFFRTRMRPSAPLRPRPPRIPALRDSEGAAKGCGARPPRRPGAMSPPPRARACHGRGGHWHGHGRE